MHKEAVAQFYDNLKLLFGVELGRFKEFIEGHRMSQVHNSLFDLLRAANGNEESRELFFTFVDDFFPKYSTSSSKTQAVYSKLAKNIRNVPLSMLFLAHKKLRGPVGQ
eukprot:NODE_497_length_7708_cov_0.291760.p4 type:complete len:108 gc:universal NODE_497_length_7708_cov_0.291760:6394-6717(+)